MGKGGLTPTQVTLGGMNPTLSVSENEAILADATQYRHLRWWEKGPYAVRDRLKNTRPSRFTKTENHSIMVLCVSVSGYWNVSS